MTGNEKAEITTFGSSIQWKKKKETASNQESFSKVLLMIAIEWK